MQNNIEIKQLTKIFNNKVKALTDISFSISQGVFGLLGQNGAGKTTLMRMIATILQPTLGSISVMGFDVETQGNQVRQLIGYLPQELDMYSSLCVHDFVSYMALIKGVKDKSQVNLVLAQVDMLEYSRRLIGQLSGGMKRRVGIAQAMVGNPQILIVDEPTVGLDPEERVHFRDLLSRYAKNGKTVILSTHIIEDVYQLCNNFAVLRQGQLFFLGNSEELMSTVIGKIKIIDVDNEHQLSEIKKYGVLISTTYKQNGIQARVMDGNNGLSGLQVTETLEDAYIYSMGGKSND